MSLSSPRFRRRVGRAALLVALLAGAVTAFVLVPKSTGTTADTSPLTGTAQLVAQPETVPLSARDRRAIDATLDRFVAGAVLRKNPGDAFELSTPALRGDTTRADWARGDLPVFPFDARGPHFHGITVTWSYPNDVGADLHLLARDESGEIGAITYNLELKRIRGSWLVDSFVPSATFAPAKPGQEAKVRAQVDYGPGAPAAESNDARLSRKWFLLPAALFAGVLLFPFVAFGVNWHRGRKAERDYWATRTSP